MRSTHSTLVLCICVGELYAFLFYEKSEKIVEYSAFFSVNDKHHIYLFDTLLTCIMQRWLILDWRLNCDECLFHHNQNKLGSKWREDNKCKGFILKLILTFLSLSLLQNNQ